MVAFPLVPGEPYRSATTNVNVILQPSEPSDIDAIFALRNCPDVLREQYKPGWFDTPRSFAKKMNRKPNFTKMSFRCSSILVDQKLVGHVMQHFMLGPRPGHMDCHLGWNLAKTYWGRGIMPQALAQLFDQLFDEHEKLSLVAACFDTNQRCKRVIEKLGFRPDRMNLLARFGHFIETRGKRTVLQFRIESADWKNEQNKAMDAEPPENVFLKWMIDSGGPVIAAVLQYRSQIHRESNVKHSAGEE